MLISKLHVTRQWSHETRGKASVNLRHDACKWVQYLGSGIHPAYLSISCYRSLSPWIMLLRAWRWPFTCVSFGVWNARSIGRFPSAGVHQSVLTRCSYMWITALSILLCVQIVTNKSAVDLGSGLSCRQPTVPYLWPVIHVFHLKLQLADG
jgi:hypothetical protein